MIIPRRIKVGGKVYRVLFPYEFKETDKWSGLSDHATNTIRISGLSPSHEPRARENVEEVFIHEMLHCVDSVYNVAKLDEETVDRLAQGLYQVLTDSGMLK